MYYIYDRQQYDVMTDECKVAVSKKSKWRTNKNTRRYGTT